MLQPQESEEAKTRRGLLCRGAKWFAPFESCTVRVRVSPLLPSSSAAPRISFPLFSIALARSTHNPWQECQQLHRVREQVCSTCVSFGVFAVLCCLERQRGCGKIGLLLRPLFPPLDATCPARLMGAAIVASLVVSLVVLEFENGSREGEPLLSSCRSVAIFGW